MLNHFLDTNTDPMTVAVRPHCGAHLIEITQGPASDAFCTEHGTADDLRKLARENDAKADALRAVARFYRRAADHLDAGK